MNGPTGGKGKILTRKIKEAERVKDQGLDRLVAEKNRLLREEKELS